MILIYTLKNQQMIKPIENRTIDNNKDIWVKIETIYPENIQTPDYDYWLSQQTIDWPIWIRNLSTWWNAKTLIFTRLASVWTWNQSFTGFWFTPTSYTIQATRTDVTTTWYPCFSDWAYDWTTEVIRQVADWYSRVTVNRIIRLFYTNQWWWVTAANHTSLDADWITLNFDLSAENCYLVITCFW